MSSQAHQELFICKYDIYYYFLQTIKHFIKSKSFIKIINLLINDLNILYLHVWFNELVGQQVFVSYKKNQMAQEFSAAPKVVRPKNKYKQQPEEQEEDQIKLIYNNLMWDKRVFRGNTYSAIVISKKNDAPFDSTNKIPMGTRNQQQQTTNNFQSNRRANIQIFTDEYVESLTDKPPRYQYASQTEPLPQKPIIRHRIQDKSGRDIQTQIWDNELFDFDYQVQPLLNVLCGRTLEMSRMEVLQQEQLRIMNNRQQELRLYEREQNKKIQNMYDAEEKLQQENMNKIEQFKKEKDQKIRTHKRVFSRVIAKQYLRDIKLNTINFVEGNGFFRNVIDYRLSSQLLPTLYLQTSAIAKEESKLTEQAEDILEVAKQTIIKEHAFAKEVEKTRRKKIVDDREEKIREKVERKKMNEQQKYMLKFLADQKAQKEQKAKKLEQKEVEQPVQQS